MAKIEIFTSRHSDFALLADFKADNLQSGSVEVW